MKKIVTSLLFALTLAALPVSGQDIDESFVFVDSEGNVIENEAVVVRNNVELYDETSEVIYSGISVKNTNGSADYLKVVYKIERIDNGTYQICFPSTCNTKAEVGSYETAVGQLMSETQNIQSEWFPEADGECVVTLTIELFNKQGLFPPTYVHKAWGPTLTLRFVKGELPPEPGMHGDVNGDGEVNIADVNVIIDLILTDADYQANADVNGDKEIGISDINAEIDLILSAH